MADKKISALPAFDATNGGASSDTIWATGGHSTQARSAINAILDALISGNIMKAVQ